MLDFQGEIFLVKYDIRSEHGVYYQCWVEEVEGMSDLSMYELEDIIWDEFDQSDDHVVPHASNDHASGNSYRGDSCKKPRREVTGISSNSGNLYVSNCVSRGEEERDSTLNKKRNMLENDPWSHTPDGVFAASCDGDTAKEVTSLASDGTRMSSNCFKSSNITSIGSEFCTDDPINDGSTAVESKSYGYPLSHNSQTDDLSFFDNDCEDKESSGLLYYGWPDIGNFEDVDGMLRSSDSSFGLGITVNENELSWLSSPDPVGGFEEAWKSDFKFPYPHSNALKSISEEREPPKLNNKRSNYISESKDEFKPKEQVNPHKKQSKHQNQTEGKRKGQFLDNGGSFYHSCDLQNNDIHLSSMGASRKVLTSVGNQQQKQIVEPDSFGYLQANILYPHPYYGHVPDRNTLGPVLSCIKAESKGLTSLSPKESFYASNQMHSMESSGDPSFQGTAIKLDDKREKVHHRNAFQPSFTSNPRHAGMAVRDPVSVQKQVHLSANEVESQSDVGVRIGISAKVGPLNVRESSSINSGLDEISLEATSFCQLQQVMEQLDVRTKLCIRDSLYRLARSAEQRHNYANLSGGCAGGALMAEETNKCTGFLDMETDTNPIDRSIAHLLFHRPSELPGMLAQNPLSLKSNMMIHGSLMMAEKLVCHEEAGAESDDKIADV